MKKEIKRLLVMGPMDCESELFFEAVGAGKLAEDANTESAAAAAERTKIAGFEFAEGSFGRGTLIAAKCLMGMSNAAACTASALLSFSPDAVIIQGTSGAHGAGLHQGDIVLAERFVNIGRYRSAHAAEGEGVHTDRWDLLQNEAYLNGEIVKTDSIASDPDMLAAAAAVPYEKGRLVRGVHGSGDVWNNEADRIIQIRELYGSDCEEMEGYAVAQTCAAFGVPVLGIRVISNSSLHEGEDFDEIYAWDCQRYTLDVARVLLG